MKRLLFLFVTVLLFGVGCEKDAKLSEFAIGNWVSQELVLGDSPLGVFTATIKTTNKYVLKFTLSESGQFITCPEAGYTIDDGKSQITIDQPTFDPENPATGTQTFDVTWKDGENTMTWTPPSGSDAPVLVWTRLETNDVKK
jgi:hypothetical protein